MPETRRILCDDCEQKRIFLEGNGDTFISCEPDPKDPNFCFLKFEFGAGVNVANKAKAVESKKLTKATKKKAPTKSTKSAVTTAGKKTKGPP